MKVWLLVLALALSLAASFTSAQPATSAAPLQFNDVAEEKRFRALVAELRCVMCQNQSLADSNAQIAVDLRHEVLALMRQGKSNREVKDFLVARYSEFVLYRPQVESKTWLLWFGPAVVLLVGGFVVASAVRHHRGPATKRQTAGSDCDSSAADDNQEW